MTISRGQMERQLRMGGGIMDIVPREPAILGGIKKAVKKVGKTVKKIAKSDIGKTALAAAALYYMPKYGIKAAGGLKPFLVGAPTNLVTGKEAFAGILGTGGQFAPSVGKIAGAFGIGAGKNMGTFGKVATLGLVSKFLTDSLGMPPEQAEAELARDPSGYLEKYYRNLNPNASDDEVDNFVMTNITEYMSTGGRVGFAEGDPLPPDPTQPVNPFKPKPIGPVLPNKMMASYGYNEAMSDTYDSYLDMKKKGLIPPTMSFDEFLQEVVPEMSNKRIEETRGVAALGGRMGFDEGTQLDRGLMSLTDETIEIPMEDTQKAPSILNKFDEEDIVIIIEMGPDGKPKLVPVPRSQVMPSQVEGGSSLAPRINRALGDTASMNAMQAAGIEGLPIRQNPKGVKELDLRETGGFIPPVGIKEKEDDIPAMLSNNEFVMTADAVRGMGGGDVNLGAQRMYDQMKMLEAGGKV